MKRIRIVLFALATAIGLCGCGSFGGGLAGGVAGAGAGYELSARQQMKKLDEDLANGRIDQKEYDTRKDQVKRGSLIY